MEQQDREQFASGLVWLVRGIAIVSISLPLSLADEPWSRFAPLFGPLGAVAVAIGAWQVVRATPSSRWARPLLGLAVLAVPLRIATEVGVLVDGVGTRFGAELTENGAIEAQPAAVSVWDVVALCTIAATFVGVIALGRHLQLVLEGVAADRWRQTTFAWLASLVIIPVSVLVGWVELLLLAGATLLTAGAFLVLSIAATHRAAEDDRLDEDFPQRRAA